MRRSNPSTSIPSKASHSSSWNSSAPSNTPWHLAASRFYLWRSIIQSFVLNCHHLDLSEIHPHVEQICTTGQLSGIPWRYFFNDAEFSWSFIARFCARDRYCGSASHLARFIIQLGMGNSNWWLQKYLSGDYQIRWPERSATIITFVFYNFATSFRKNYLIVSRLCWMHAF